MEFSENEYEELIEELFSKHPSVQNAGFKAGAYKPGLDGMKEFDRSLGEPWRSYRTIHVAGTNGKGSVSSMLAAALSARGLRVGLYTSPHLLDFRERMKIVRGGKFEMPDKEFVWEFLHSGQTDGLSFFEITTGMAFKWFEREKVDIAVIETGLGGRLDSTNIIRPELSIVTSIGLDHCALLGDTRAKIAYEKAGIFKSGVPALVWGHDAETSSVFEEVAGRVGSPLFFADEMEPGVDENALVEKLDLQASCQRVNLHTVLCALRLLGSGSSGGCTQTGSSNSESGEEDRSAGACSGGILPEQLEAISRAAAITGLHGRWEILRREPLVIADIGHNPQALKLNFQRLEELAGGLQKASCIAGKCDTASCVAEDKHGSATAENGNGSSGNTSNIVRERSGRQISIVYGVMADKDLEGIAPFMPLNAKYYLCAPKTERSLEVEKLHHELSRMRPDLNLRACPSVAEAVGSALHDASPGSIIYIGGSTFVVAEALVSNTLNH